MHQLDRDALTLGPRLGLGNLNQPQPHHGYSNGCVCDNCLEREHMQQLREQIRAERVANRLTRTPVQPWEVRPTRRAA